MKRSEAITHIVNVLRLTGNHYCDDGRDIQDAERILKRIEVIGMLPPMLEEESFKMLPSGEMIYNVNEWEPEDEEK